MRYGQLSMLQRLWFFLIVLGLVSLRLLAQPNPAQATSIVVNSLADNGPGNCVTTCTLRDAITSANTGDTITFSVTGTITLTGGTLVIGKNLTISQLGGSLLAVDGNNAVTVFTIASGSVTLSGLTIQHGLISGGNGGGIWNNGTLTLSNSTISGNTANGTVTSGGNGGGILNNGTLTIDSSTISGNAANGILYGGGGILNNGSTLAITNSTFSSNSAGGGRIDGGAIYNNIGTLTVSNSTFSGNSAWDGGAILNGGSATISNSTLAGNTATYGGGLYNISTPPNLGSNIIAGNRASSSLDIYGAVNSLGSNIIGSTSGASGFISSDQQNVDPLLNGLANNGGPTQTMSLKLGSPAILKGNCNLSSPASAVSADQRGTARKSPTCDVGAHELAFNTVVKNTNNDGDYSLRVTMTYAPAGTTVTFDPTVFNVARTITLTSGPITIAANQTISGPGANLLAVDGHFSSQVFQVNSGVTASISGLTIQHGSGEGGGIWNSGTLTVSNSTFSNNSAYYDGGAIYNYFGTLTVSNSTFSGNSVDSGGGGGIYNNGTLTVSNSTFSNNSAYYGGGAIFNAGSGPLVHVTVSNSTFSGNTAAYGGGGAIFMPDSTLNLGSTIVAGNTALGFGPGPDIYGAVTSLGSNLIGNTSGATATWQTSDQQNVDPLLNPLASNGGPTQTMSLQATSPAMLKGNCTLSSPASPVSTDQRGVARKTLCDVGAYEVPYSSVVRNTNDSGADSLRVAVMAAPAGTTVTFDPTVFNVARTITLTSGAVTIATNQTISGPGANLLAVDGNNASRVFVVNSGVSATISGLTIQHGNISGGDGGGIVNNGTLTINNSTFSGNSASYSGSSGGDGGGIVNNGTLTINNSTFSANTASFGTGVNNAVNGGGAIHNTGTLTVNSTTLSHNSAINGGNGGGIANLGTLTISNSTVSGNSTYNGAGGIFAPAGMLTISNSTVSGNSAGGPAGGIYVGGGTLTVSNSTVSGNSAGGGGGGILNLGTLNLGSTIVSGNTASLAGTDIYGTVTSLGNNLIGNTSDATTTWQASDQQNVDPLLNPLADNGGPTQTMSFKAGSTAFSQGNCNLPASPVSTDQRGTARKSPQCDVGAFELPYSSVVRNTNDDGDYSLRVAVTYAPPGTTVTFDPLVFNVSRTIVLTSGSVKIGTGQVISGPGANLLAVDGHFSSQVFRVNSGVTATISGLTIQNGNYGLGDGGGIYNNNGTLTISNSTLSGNSAPNGNGGGIFNGGTLTIRSSTFTGNSANLSGGGIDNEGTLTISNSTFSGNSAVLGNGGGIYNDGTLTVGNSTIFGNSAAFGGGLYNISTPNLGSTIVAGNSGLIGDADIKNAITSLGYNLIGNTSGTSGLISSDQHDINPLLNPLASNGGPTQTISLQAGSPAIGKGNCNLPLPAETVATDQRGVTRKSPQCDVGAYESTTSRDTVGIYNTANGEFYLSKDNAAILSHFTWGPGSPWVAISGDWDGNGSDTIGIYNTTDGEFYLTNNNATIASHFVWGPGNPWAAIVGDWNGDGIETIGIYNTANGAFYLSNNNSTIASHFVWGPGSPWTAIVGDWDGNGTDTIGIYNTANGEFYLTNNNAAIASHFVWGPGGTWSAITGDWDGNGTETIGIYNTANGEFYLTNNNAAIASHFVWGPGGTWKALAGKWAGTTLPSQPSQSQPTAQPAPTFVPKK